MAILFIGTGLIAAILGSALALVFGASLPVVALTYVLSGIAGGLFGVLALGRRRQRRALTRLA